MLFFLRILLVLFLFLSFSSCSVFEQALSDSSGMKNEEGKQELSSSLEDVTSEIPTDYFSSDIHNQEESNVENNIQSSLQNNVSLPKLRTDFKKPTVAIVIDDVVFAAQIRHLKKLKIKVTPSIMPNGEVNLHSNQLATLTPFYMVHFPLEAENFHQKEHIVLKVGDTEEVIRKRVQQIKEEFPDVKFVNNHTGSKFTADYTVMKFLLTSLKEEGIVFVDSKTTSKSVASQVYHEIGEKILERNIFLDYDKNSTSIRKQLHATIALAKKRGYAFAIGHPYPETLEVLSDPSLLTSGVEFVYLYELFE